MNREDLIATEEICVRYKVEHQFISYLFESGIIEIVKVEEVEYLPQDHLGEFERMARLYRDLDINLEGLEAIHHLLRQIEKLQKDNRRLRNRLGLYE